MNLQEAALSGRAFKSKSWRGTDPFVYFDIVSRRYRFQDTNNDWSPQPEDFKRTDFVLAPMRPRQLIGELLDVMNGMQFTCIDPSDGVRVRSLVNLIQEMKFFMKETEGQDLPF